MFTVMSPLWNCMCLLAVGLGDMDATKYNGHFDWIPRYCYFDNSVGMTVCGFIKYLHNATNNVGIMTKWIKCK